MLRLQSMLRRVVFALPLLILALMLFAIAPPVLASDWSAEWRQTLSSLWSETKVRSQQALDPQRFRPARTVEIGVAYGTEKRSWLEWAVAEFAKTPAGRQVKVNLIPMGSIEGARAVLAQDQRIQVWTPASSIVENLLVEPWERANGQSPIFSDAPLALTPMVIVMWEDRYQAFIDRYQEVNFKTLATALAEPTGWAAIANRPEWGLFTFGHTKPTHSNSGLLTLALMAHDYHNVGRRLSAEQIMDADFLAWMSGVSGAMHSDETSTGRLMNHMLQFGPSELSGAMVYENLALEGMATASGRWGTVKVIYPTRSVWNDNPFYILDVPWSSAEQRVAAQLFQNFLLSAEAQKVARDRYLFRPANLEVPIIGAGSAFDQLQGVVQIDVPTIQRSSGDVLEQLIQVWRRTQ